MYHCTLSFAVNLKELVRGKEAELHPPLIWLHFQIYWDSVQVNIVCSIKSTTLPVIKLFYCYFSLYLCTMARPSQRWRKAYKREYYEHHKEKYSRVPSANRKEKNKAAYEAHLNSI